jgi:hypothetical protein
LKRFGGNSSESIRTFKFEAVVYFKVKGKAIPLQARTGPEGTRRLRFSDFKTIGT